MLKFYFNGSPNPTKVALFLEEAGIPYESVAIDTRNSPFSVPTASASAAPSLTPEEEEIYGPRVELPGGLLLKQLGKVALYGGTVRLEPAAAGGTLLTATLPLKGPE